VIALPKWGWMMGTGIYLDDVDQALAKIDVQQSRNIHNTMLWIAGLAILPAVAVASSGLALNISELRVADAKLKVLAQRVVESQEEERARLSRDLHDGISQWLVSIKLQIEAGVIRLASGNPSSSRRRGQFEHTAEELSNVLGEVRRISHNLRRPSWTTWAWLPPCITWPRNSPSSGTPVHFEATGSTDGCRRMWPIPCCSAWRRKR
jgi:two-component system NarL family sensor kinase